MKLGEYLQHDAVAWPNASRAGTSGAGTAGVRAAPERAGPAENQCDLPADGRRSPLPAQPAAGTPFAGVPFLIKDCAQDYAGLPTSTAADRCGRRRRRTCPCGAALSRCGLVIFGKTNLPELALKAVGLASLRPCLQSLELRPHARRLQRRYRGRGRLGVVPMAAGNDGGGSIRIPAACCGLFGLRPSRGRISSGPAYGEYWYGASSEGVISRSVRDTAAALDVSAGSPAILLSCPGRKLYANDAARPRPAAYRL